MLSDAYYRKIENIRLSISDSCNMRCQYCIPAAGAHKLDRSSIMSFEEITRMISIFVRLGVRNVRITGGEPLVRNEVVKLISMLNGVPGLQDIALTTNGMLLKKYAADLKEAGLSRINIHLDTLDKEKFKKITRGGKLQDILDGIKATKEAGFSPIKINTVLLKGVNDSEILAWIEFASKENLISRFIELMPIGEAKKMPNHFLESSFVIQTLSKKWTLIPYDKKIGMGPATYYKIKELDILLGIIHAVSEPFCKDCNRIRISADGRLQDCLVYDDSSSLLSLLRTRGLSDDKIKRKIKQMLQLKRQDHRDFNTPECAVTPSMYGIGG